MIGFLKHLVFDDFWRKLLSTALAAGIWFTVTFATHKEGASRERVFARVPVTLMAAEGKSFTAVPEYVEVKVRGDAKAVGNLQATDIRAIVDPAGVVVSLRKPVQVATPAGVTFVRAMPQEVRVETLNR